MVRRTNNLVKTEVIDGYRVQVIEQTDELHWRRHNDDGRKRPNIKNRKTFLLSLRQIKGLAFYRNQTLRVGKDVMMKQVRKSTCTKYRIGLKVKPD